MVEGLRVASAASAWALLAEELRVRELMVRGDAIVRIPGDHRGRTRPDRALATIDQLERAAAAGRRRGIHHLRRALDEVCTESASPLETEFRLDAGAAGLPPAELDREVCDGAGRRLGISEFVYPEWRVVAEIEGDHHRTSRRQWERDLAKYAAYADAGWEVVRLTGAQVRRGTAVPHLARALTRRSRAGFGGRSTSESASDSGVD